MINDGKKDEFDLILTKEISRFSRNTLDSIKYTQELLMNGVGVLFESDNINTIMPDSELRLTIMSSVAQEEVRKLSERVRFGFRRSIEKREILGNNNVYGYEKKDKGLTIIEEEAKWIREMYTMYAQGEHGTYTLAKALGDRGMRTKQGKKPLPTTIKRMIENPKYKGYYRINAFPTLDYKSKKQIRNPKEKWEIFECKEKIPAIVSEELWDKANAILEARQKDLKEKVKSKDVFQNRYPLSTLMHCGEHTDRVFTRKGIRKGKTEVMWMCSEYNTKGRTACESPFIYETEIMQILKKVLKKFKINKDRILADLVSKYEKVDIKKNFEREISRLEKEIEKVKSKRDKLLELNINGFIEMKELAERNTVLNDEILVLKDEIDVIRKEKEGTSTYKDNISKIRKVIENKLNVEKNIDRLIPLLIEKITVSKINNDRRKIKLDIEFKFGKGLLETLDKTKKKDCQINSQKCSLDAQLS
ncbi:MAG: recombinase family protein [Oscillospiraceae bacterium]|nr:recombinase family protein [Oscillospiraceae bacterium]